MEVTKDLLDKYHDYPMSLSTEEYKACEAFIAQEHIIECGPLLRADQAKWEAWKAMYPYHCTACDGAGGEVVHNYPHAPDDFDTCPRCVEKGICPRCGEVVEAWENDCDAPCPCGWNWGRNKEDQAPQPY